MKKPERLLIALFLLCGALTYYWKNTFQSTTAPEAPAPTEDPRFSEEDGLHFLRREWWAQIHQTRRTTDWRQMEYQTQWTRFEHRRDGLSLRSEGCQVNLADTDFTGIWKERGSTNQAGSVYQTEYHAGRDEIWLLSAGGSLWKAARQNPQWSVVNQQLQFDPGLLKFIRFNDRERLLALIGRIPHFSEDGGQNWTPAQGIDFDHGSGRIKDVVVLDNFAIYALSQSAAGQPARLHKSTDGGRRFQTVSIFPIRDLDRIGLFLPFHSAQPFLAYKNDDNTLAIHGVNPQNNTLQALPSHRALRAGLIPVNLTGWHTDTLSRWYAYVEQNNALRLYQTNDQGFTWEDRGLLPAVPWEVGIKGSPSDPDLLFLGEVECFRSRNGGKNWKKVNNWHAYYNDIHNNLHADMMHFGEYKTAAGAPFMLISHHGGLSYSEDFFTTQRNLATEGLNITQYYDAQTSPLDANLVFAGSQDQGLQANAAFYDEGAMPLTQFLPGDYDHLTFTRNGRSLWAVSPGGWVAYLNDATRREVTATWTLPYFESALWLPPVAALPNPDKSQVLLAGGSLRNGGGAFLIQLEAEGDKIRSKQFPMNFQAASGGGGLSAVAICRATNRWYAATTNGRFFSSGAQGEHWTAAAQPAGQSDLFYSLAILPSAQDPNVVYWAGSGYDQPAVYRSTDGGQSFSPFAQGLPPTVVFDLAANEDESLLVAATQAGPYLYNRAEGKWIDLSAPCTPVQTFLSAEYIPQLQTVRFSTFGRGIWDLTLDAAVAIRPPKLEVGLKVFPNPTTDRLQLLFGKEASHPLQWTLFTNAGQLVLKGAVPAYQSIAEIDLSGLAPGVYFLRLHGDGKTVGQRIVKF